MNRIIKPITLSATLALLISGYHYIDKYLSGIIFIALIILILVLTILIIINIIKEIIKLFRNSHNLSFKLFVPILIYLIIPSLACSIDLGKLESNVVLCGWHKGTQNQAYILFRRDNTFEINWTGVFFYDEWFTGHWKRNGDTILLHYNNDKMVKQLGNKVVIQNGYFKPINNGLDSSKYRYTMFHVGNCNEENINSPH
jgi:hypothetical protein